MSYIQSVYSINKVLISKGNTYSRFTLLIRHSKVYNQTISIDKY